jgi:4a-hydroxytetrahydrobiopterin dehydratase
MALLDDAEVRRRLEGSGWRLEDGALVRDLEFEDFRGAIAFVDRLADAAEEAGHHPDVLVHGYRHVRLTLSTHSEGGVTERDLALAPALDALA